MSCEQSEMWMMDALDGALSASDQRRLADHLGACSHCRAEWEALNALDELLVNPTMLAPAPGFVGRVEARLERFEAQRRTLLGGLILLGAAMALCLLAVPPLLNGRNLIEAYGAFLQGVYELFSYVALLNYKLVSALWFILDVLARSVGISLTTLLTYAAGAVLAMVAWWRSLTSQRSVTQTLQRGH